MYCFFFFGLWWSYVVVTLKLSSRDSISQSSSFSLLLTLYRLCWRTFNTGAYTNWTYSLCGIWRLGSQMINFARSTTAWFTTCCFLRRDSPICFLFTMHSGLNRCIVNTMKKKMNILRQEIQLRTPREICLENCLKKRKHSTTRKPNMKWNKRLRKHWVWRKTLLLWHFMLSTLMPRSNMKLNC